MICTWKDCQAKALQPQLDREGNEWANLCVEHAKKLNDAINSRDAKKTVGAWACAGKDHPSRKRHIETIAKGCSAIISFFGRRK